MRAGLPPVALGLLLILGSAPGAAQQPAARPSLTTADYARAEKFLAPRTAPLVFGASVRPAWLDGDRFWYRNTTAAGAEFVVVDPVRRTRQVVDSSQVVPAGRAAPGAGARGGLRNTVVSPDGKRAPSFGTGISGSAISRPAPRGSSPPTA